MNRASYQQALHKEVLNTISSENSNFEKMGARVCTWLLPSEEIKMEEEDVVVQLDERKVVGRAFVTNYRLRFESSEEEKDPVKIDVTLGSISKVEKKGYSNVNKDSYGLEVHCKDMRNIIFLHRPETHSRRPLYDNLQRYAFPNTNKMPFFATFYSQRFSFDGWSLYKARTEFQRMGVPNNLWDFTKINNNYEFASTYPVTLVVPTAALNKGDDFIRSVGEFRSKRRIPILSWYDPVTTATITRCAQPMVGVTSKRSAADEMMLQLILEANKYGKRLKILDARPIVNAKVNRAKGGGYEERYPNCELVFLDIQNIHVVRESLRKIKDACFPKIDHKNFYKLVDESKWLSHLQTIIEGARMTACEVAVRRQSVLVHCSDGWDRTAQVSALAMLLLDPYFRTLEGFAVLIEKEWCSCGHKFAHRIGHGEDKHSDEERSPIFVQFIDCVWQFLNQFVSCFEFNVRFLKTILDELFACRFGTFLYNSEKERRDLEVKSTTVSLWSYILEKKELFINPNYSQESSIDLTFFGSSTPFAAKLWTEYYCRYNPQVVLPETEVDAALPNGHLQYQKTGQMAVTSL